MVVSDKSLVDKGSRKVSTVLWSPYLVTGIVIFLLWLWYAVGLGADGLSKFDEFLTYDRSLGFARNNDWLTVYSQNEPSLKKPPLQYWTSAFLMELGLSDNLALHLPSMVFTLGVLIATAWLARVMIPELPSAMLPAVLLLASSKEFWSHADSAMLDSGAMLFSTLGLIAMFAAFERPKLWPYFGLVVFLAGMQKTPTPLAFLALALASLLLTQKWQDRPFSEIWKNKTFLWTIAISLVLAFAWPLFQYFRYGPDAYFQGSLKSEVFDRFSPGASQRGVEEIIKIVFGNEPALRLAGIAGLCALPFALGRPRLLAATGIVLFFFAAMWMASGEVYGRYTLLVLPVLMVGAAGGILLITKKPWVRVLLVAVLCLSKLGPIKRNVDYRFETTVEKFGIDLRDLLEPMQSMIQPGETLVICGIENHRRLPLGAAAVYASPDQPFVYMRHPDLQGYLDRFGYTSGPLRGVCRAKELDLFADALIGLTQQPVGGTAFVYWTAEGLSGR